jgi:hypothetical protein
VPPNDPIISEMLAEQAYGPITSAAYGDAARSARANETARSLGMAPDIVEAALPDMMAQDRTRKRIEQTRFNAAYARIMANTRLAASAIDDDHLPSVAQKVDQHRNFLDFNRIQSPIYGTQARALAGAGVLLGRLLSGTAEVARGVIGVGTAAGENIRPEQMGGLGTNALPLLMLRYLGRPAGQGAESLAQATRYETNSRNFNDVASGFESVPGSLAALGVTALTKSPLAGAAALGAVTGGQSYLTGRDAGLTPHEAFLYGAGDAVVETGTELAPERFLGRALKVLPGGGSVIREGMKALGFEVGGEQVATALQGLNQWYWIDSRKGQTFQQYLSALPDQERSTLVATLTTFGLTVGGGHIARQVANTAVDRASGVSVDRIMEASAQSPTRTANPSDFEEALNQLVGDSSADKLYVPAEKVQELFQSNEGGPSRSIEDDPYWSRHAADVAEAAALGGDVVIPLSEAATHLAGSTDWAKIREFVRTRPGGASLAETKDKLSPDELEKVIAETAEHLARTVPKLQSQRLTRDFATGMGYQGEQAEKITELVAAAMTRAYAVESAKRVSRGEQAPNLEDFAGAYLPQSVRMTQAEHDAAAKGEPVATQPGKASPEQLLHDFWNRQEERGGKHKAVWAVRSKDGAIRSWSVNKKQSEKALGKGDALTKVSPAAAPLKQSGGTVAALTGGELGEVDASNVVQRASAYYREHLQGRSIQRPEIGEVKFTRRGIKKTRRGLPADLVRAQLIPAIPEIIAKGAYQGRFAIDKPRPDSIVAFHFVYAPVEIAGRTYQAGVSIAEDAFGNFYYNINQDPDALLAKRKGPSVTDEKAPGPGPRYEQGSQQRGNIDDAAAGINLTLDDTQSRGNISIQRNEHGVMTGAVIRAFEAADFSTAVHELGHFFLEDLRRRALSGDATEQEKADWATFKDWAQNDLDGLVVDDKGLVPVEAHEAWARGFERYIWEGQAPAKGLKMLFARMRDFMIELYRSVAAFNSPITPQIREVMDRLLASDDEIAAQREAMALASDALGGLMSEAEGAEYQELVADARSEAREKLFTSVLSSLRREREAEVRERKAEIRSEVEADVATRPVFQALRLLRTGLKQDDGSFATVRLSREQLTGAYGPEIIDQLPKGVPPIVGDTDTLDVDQIADMTGFNSGDELVKALTEHEAERQAMRAEGDRRSPRARLVDELTDTRLRNEIGDPFANLEEEAQAALANERQGDQLSLELRAIARKSGRRPTPWKLATEWAHRRLIGQSVKEAVSGASLAMYARNAAKAAHGAEEALAKQEFNEAFQFKQQQLLNLALLSQGKAIKDQADTAARRLKNIARRKTIPSVDQDYLDQAHQLLEQVDLKTRPQSRVDKRLAFEAWHAEQVRQGVEPVVPPEYRQILGTTHWTRLPVSELLDLDRAVGQVIELGRLKQRLIDGKRSRDFDDAVAELQGAAGNQPPRAVTADNDPNRRFGGRVKSRLRGIDAAMIKVEQMVRVARRRPDSNGPWRRICSTSSPRRRSARRI